jgi:Uma2 family endonuclease
MATGTHLRLGKADHGRIISAEEFAEAEFDEPYSYEREGGRLVVLLPEGYGHQSASEPWRDALVLYKVRNPGVVRHVFSGAWVRPDEDRDRIGDIGVYLTATPETEPGVEPIPDLVFEIVSPGKANRTRDYVTKRAIDESLGVKEYVIVDRFERRVTVLTLGEGGYDERVLTDADTYTSPLLPGFEVRIADVF